MDIGSFNNLVNENKKRNRPWYFGLDGSWWYGLDENETRKKILVGLNGLKINLGCGLDRRDGYLNIDIRTDVGADVVMNLDNIPYPFADNSADEILAKDVIEHFSFRDIDRVIKELHRILKAGKEGEGGGKLIVQTPDLEQIIGSISSKEISGFWNISYWLYGGQDYRENCHKLIFTKDELKLLLEKIGFRVDNIYSGGTNLVCEAVRK